jgi:hypothetical protein
LSVDTSPDSLGSCTESPGRRNRTLSSLMSEASQKRSTTQRFIEQFPACCFCGGLRPATTREHMPPKSLFDNSHRPDKLVMPACDECNRGTSTADLVVALVSRWNYNSAVQERLDHRKLSARVRRQAPELTEEWNSALRNDPIQRAGARRHLIEHGVPVPDDAGLVTIGPLTIRQLNLFAHKVTLALYFEHFRHPLSGAGRFCSFWRSKEDFMRDGIPPIFFETFPKYGTIKQGQWNERETFEYRHDFNVDEGLFGCFARFRLGFFVFGPCRSECGCPSA